MILCSYRKNFLKFYNMTFQNYIFLFLLDNVVLSGYGSQASSKKMTGFGYSIKTESNFIYLFLSAIFILIHMHKENVIIFTHIVFTLFASY